MTTNRTW